MLATSSLKRGQKGRPASTGPKDRQSGEGVSSIQGGEREGRGRCLPTKIWSMSLTVGLR